MVVKLAYWASSLNGMVQVSSHASSDPSTLQLQSASCMGPAPDMYQPDMSRSHAVYTVADLLTILRASVRAQLAMMMQVGGQPRVGRRLGLTRPDSSDDSDGEGASQGQPVSF